MNTPPPDRITKIAARQHGVVTRPQLLQAGLTSRAVECRLASGRLHRLHRGVYLLGDLRGRLAPEKAREMAAVLACGSGAVLSHRSAACLWRILPPPRPGTPIDVTVPRRRRGQRKGIRVRRAVDLARTDTARLDGIPLTTPLRTLRDLATVLDVQSLSQAAAWAERQKLVSEDELVSLAARHHGLPGASHLRAVVGADGGPAFTRSEAEERFLHLVRSGGLPTPEANVTIQGHEVDFLWRSRKLVVEVDGFAFHASRSSFEGDRRRDGELAAAGFNVVRVTWKQIDEEPNVTLVLVAQALAVAATRAEPSPAAGR